MPAFFGVRHASVFDEAGLAIREGPVDIVVLGHGEHDVVRVDAGAGRQIVAHPAIEGFFLAVGLARAQHEMKRDAIGGTRLELEGVRCEFADQLIAIVGREIERGASRFVD